MITFVTAFFSLVFLIIIHELGHFLLAKKFKVKVEEFGIGYPPRIIGKKIGETIYSLNLLPFGAFVKMPGEIERTDDPDSFSRQSVGKRILIAFGGVLSFWIIAALLFTVVFGLGAPVVIEDGDSYDSKETEIKIANIAQDSPAEKAGFKIGDTILQMSAGCALCESISPVKVKDIQDFTNSHLGKDITIKIKRGDEVLELSLMPRESPPKGEAPMGVALIKTAVKKYPWYSAPFKGLSAVGELTFYIIKGYAQAIFNVFRGEPAGVEMVGPIGVFQMLSESQKLGIVYFLNFLALISLHLAVFNALPIPAVDGGRVLFLAIEGIRKKPIPEKIELNVITFSFVLLLILMIWVTIKDVARLF